MRDLLSFRAPPAARGPDPAVHALPRLRELRDALRAAAQYRDACRRAAAPRWGVPPLFFFDRPLPNNSARLTDEVMLKVARRVPAAARAWAELRERIDILLEEMAEAVPLRQAARAVPGLRAAATDLAPDHPEAADLAAVLAVPDDLVVTALDPAGRAGWRVRLRGVADLFQFHVLLADLLPGPKPDPQVVDVYRDGPPTDAVATARFQFFKPAALRPDGTLPPRFADPDGWLWGHESPKDIPVAAGERVVLLGEPPYPRRWPAGRACPHVRGEVELLSVLGTAAVGGWLRTLGAEPATRRHAA